MVHDRREAREVVQMRLIRRWEGLQRSGTRAHVRAHVCEQLSQSRRLGLPRIGDKGMITHLRGLLRATLVAEHGWQGDAERAIARTRPHVNVLLQNLSVCSQTIVVIVLRPPCSFTLSKS